MRHFALALSLLATALGCSSADDDANAAASATTASSGGPGAGGSGGEAAATTVSSSATTGAGGEGGSGGEGGAGGGGASIPGYDLVWSDDFDATIDPARWTFDIGGAGWGNNELESYTSRPENAAIESDPAEAQPTVGLAIHALSEVYTGVDNITRNYTSARLKTQGLISFKYGRIEARIKLPFGQGIWPAFWALGDDIAQVGWPSCGEIDILENVGFEPTTVHGSLHGPGYSGGSPLTGTYSLPVGQSLSAEYHVYSVEWDPYAIRWYVDSTLYETQTPGALPQGSPWAFDHPFFVILNVAVGGDWPGAPDASTTFPQTMRVDYVRVYKAKNEPFAGQAASLPGVIEAERFDTGGELTAYHDADYVNQGGVFRPEESVDLQATTDAGGGYAVAWATAGEWLEYTVDVGATGVYAMKARVASQGQGGAFHVEIDGDDVTGPMIVPDTGDWDAYLDVSAAAVSLTAGVHVLRLSMDASGPVTAAVGNFNRLTFE